MPDRLTPRQREILRALERGASNKEIARALRLSHLTVRDHISEMLRQFGARSRLELIVRATDASGREGAKSSG